MDKRPIGIFDSGLGGLTVVKEIMKILPGEDLVYFGDMARIPYGTKSKETITKYSFQNMRFLLCHDIKAVVVACNTASANSLPEIKKSFDIQTIGVVEPGARGAIKATINKRIGIIGTQATINSKAYNKPIHDIIPDAKIFYKACPLFVQLVEEGWIRNKVAYLTAEIYLKKLKEANIDTLVLGCTHYPLLLETISDIMGKGVKMVNPAVETALHLKELLTQYNMLNCSSNVAQYYYYTSDNVEQFKKLGSMFLNREISNVEKINIEDY